ncbi:MAG: DsbA family protein [Gammaproteobacteria bacterium]|nr:DsbA family protein [Gammaproteobacteria bacterium]
MKTQHLVAAASVLLIAIFAIATWLYNTQKADEISATAQQNSASLVREHSPTMGDANAKVTIVEFFDPACGTCRNFHPFVKDLMKANPGKIKLVMRYTPLHPGSDEVVKILETARLQNKFWEVLEETYATQSAWVKNHVAYPDKLWAILPYSGIDIEKAKQDILDPAVALNVQQDMADARQLQVDKTPGFFVNGKPLVEFGYEQLQALVESEVRASY